jgi:hypothetical protein
MATPSRTPNARPPQRFHRLVQRWLREIKQQELDHSRSYLLEELRVLRSEALPPALIDRMMRRVAEQTSQHGLLTCVEEFDVLLSASTEPQS